MLKKKRKKPDQKKKYILCVKPRKYKLIYSDRTQISGCLERGGRMECKVT